MKSEARHPIRILSLDGSDIYRAMHLDGGRGLSVRDERGKLDANRFRAFLDQSLDTDRMAAVCRAHGMRFITEHEYTTAVVNVTFDGAVKAYYNRGKALYIRDGHEVLRDELVDHVCVRYEEGVPTLAAIEVADGRARDYAPVESPIDSALLGEYFSYDAAARVYRVCHRLTADGKDTGETAIGRLQGRGEVRAYLYAHGFDIDGLHYVRYKRSAGSSREGQCLFIAEPLYEDMMRWSACGLDPTTVADQASWQAYISLTLSSIERKIHIPKQSILLIKDEHSIFTDDVVAVTEGGAGLVAERGRAEITNTIWDGEALLDESVFAECGYADKGMMLLRNRFFKTCAFNTRLQAFFADHGITRLSQLRGWHSPTTRSVRDIKLVITESSLKYLKFMPKGADPGEWLSRWMEHVYTSKEDSLFGVVKTDKPSGPMGNTLVRTNYQLLNTLSLTRADAEELLAPSFDFLAHLQNDPMYLRYHTSLLVADTDAVEDGVTSENYRQRLIADVMRRSDGFEGTRFYRDYRAELCRSFKERLKHGRVLVDGGYHTLLGNGLEFLHAVIDPTYQPREPLALGNGEIFTERFADGEALLCERSPHITMGNLLVAKNRHVEEIKRYFNLGTAHAIVCVNAIGENLQQRLNGCDYDSDTMLITNCPTLLRAAEAHYAHFPVPFCGVPSGDKRTYTTSPADLALLDGKIAENCIGEIVNLSQFLNSLYWDKLAGGGSEAELCALYADICKLAVLSGMEIDKAKRSYAVKSSSVLNEVRRHKTEYKKKNGDKIPEFFAYITEAKDGDGVSAEATLNTAMSFVYDAVRENPTRAERSKTTRYTDLFALDFRRGDPTGVYSKRRDAVLREVAETQTLLRRFNLMGKAEGRAERALAVRAATEALDLCIAWFGKNADDHLYDLLLQELDYGERSEGRVSAYHSLLFAVMCYARDGYLLTRLKPAATPMCDLIHREDAPAHPERFPDVRMVYGHPHAVIPCEIK